MLQKIADTIAWNPFYRSLYALINISLVDFIGYRMGSQEYSLDLEKNVGLLGAAIGFYGVNIMLRNQYQAAPGMKTRLFAGVAGAIINYCIINYLFELARHQSLLENIVNYF